MAESCCKRMRIDSTSFAIVDANHSYLIEYDLVSNDGTDVVNGRVLYDGVRNVLTIRGDKSMWDVVSFGGFSRLRFNCPDGKSIDIKSSVGPELSWISCSTSSGTKVIDDVDKILAGVGDDNDDVMTGRGSPSEDGKFAGQIYSDSLNGKVYVWLGSEWADVSGEGVLPDATAQDVGKLLYVDSEGNWSKSQNDQISDPSNFNILGYNASNQVKVLDASVLAKAGDVATAKDVVHYDEVVGYLRANSGNVTNDTNYHSFVTNYLEVAEGDEILYRGNASGSSASVAYYDSSKNFVSSVQHSCENSFVSIEVPNGVKYCRVGSFAITSNTIVFECYVQNTNAYGTKKTLDSLSALVSVINKAVLSYSEYAGYFLKTDGHFKSDSTYHSFATDLVKVNEGDKFYYRGYATGNSSSVLFFNANKVFVSSLEYDSRTLDTEVTIPSGVSFVRFSSLASASADIVFEVVYKKSREWGTKAKLESIEKVVETNLLPYVDYNAILSNTTGKVTTSTKYHSFVTDKIPCAEGEKFMYKGQGTGAPASAVFYDSNGDKVSTYQVKSLEEYTEVTIPSGVSFVSFASWANIGSAITFGAFKRSTIIDDLYKEFSSFRSASPLKGKKVCFIGDSITEQAKYVSAFQSLSGCVVINRGKSGCSIAKNSKRADSFVERYDNGAGNETNQFPANADVDMFICLGGINDFGNASYYDIDFGSLTDAIDKETFCGALRYFYNGMKTRYPTKPIVVASMLHSQHYVRSSDSQYLPGWDEIVEGENGAFSYKVNPKGATLPQYHDAVRDVCKMYGIPFVDMFNCGISALVESDRTNYYQDGLHPNDDGGVKMAQYLYRQICSMVNL